MEKGLYTQVFNLRWKDLKCIAANKYKNESKFKFQGLSARSQRWFDLDFDCIEVNFSTHDPDLYKRIFQSHDNSQDKNIFESFQVLIGNSKCVEIFKFHNGAPILKYCQKSLNSCCFIILASSFASIKKIKAVNAL